MPLNYLLKMHMGRGYKFTKSLKKINHLMYTDDVNVFAKNEKRTGDLDTNNKNIQPGYEIWH